MPHDPVAIRSDNIEAGREKLRIEAFHEAPAGPGDEVLVDDRKGADIACAKSCMELLQKHYPGWWWKVVADSQQGIVTINIPILMGNWVFNIRGTELSERMVIRAGGEILERFRLPRSAVDLARFIEARPMAVSRANHRMPG